MLVKAASTNNATAIVCFGIRIAVLTKRPRIFVLRQMGMRRLPQILTALCRTKARAKAVMDVTLAPLGFGSREVGAQIVEGHGAAAPGGDGSGIMSGSVLPSWVKFH